VLAGVGLVPAGRSYSVPPVFLFKLGAKIYMMPKPIISICGPTATGKTSLALNLCQEVGGEVVSVDSRQVYRGVDIGTGKGMRGECYNVRQASGYWDVEDKRSGRTVRINLYDIIEPDEELNVVQFSKLAGSVIKKIWSRNEVPFLVGGAGLYFEVLLGMVEVARVPIDRELRHRLANLSNEELFYKLKELDPVRAQTIDRNSPHRLVRAIEIAIGRRALGGRRPDTVRVLPEDLEPLWIGINAPREVLYGRIDHRVEEMLEEGLLEEIASLVGEYGWGAPALNSIGYIEFKPYFEGEMSLEECVQKVKFNSHAYARRQLTWFRRNKKIRWFDLTTDGFESDIKEMIESYLSDI